MKYLRMVVGHSKEDINSLTGVFTETAILQDDGKLTKKENKLLKETYAWFNENLPCPPWDENDWDYGVTWFKKGANEFINKMWELANLLKEHGKPIRMIKMDNPGKIVYEDDYQVVAVAWVDVCGTRHRKANAKKRLPFYD